MEREKIEKFAEMVKEVSAYFKEITPTTEDSVFVDCKACKRIKYKISDCESYESCKDCYGLLELQTVQAWCTDESKEVRDLFCPIDSIAFENAFREFKNELEANILSHDRDFIISLLEHFFLFSNIMPTYSSHILPTYSQLISRRLEKVIEVLSTYKRSNDLITKLWYSEDYYKEYRAALQKESNNTLYQPSKIDIPQSQTDYNIPTEILQALEQNGCITQNPLQWLKSKSLLGYFAECMNDKYNLKHGQKRMIKPFENMFGMSGLSGSINDYKKTGDLPIGYEIIDNILK